jgi:XTP/dITP diphosphohydrolase/ATP diphosphatase
VENAVDGAAAAVLRNWEEIKLAEKKPKVDEDGKTASRLDEVLRGMPALSEAAKLGAKAQKAGFDWQSWRDLLPKVAEEVAELEAEAASDDPTNKARVEAELGDLLFTVVNLGRHLGVDAEMALRGCNLRFRNRFREMELAAEKPLEELGAAELEALWAAAKKKLSTSGTAA